MLISFSHLFSLVLSYYSSFNFDDRLRAVPAFKNGEKDNTTGVKSIAESLFNDNMNSAAVKGFFFALGNLQKSFEKPVPILSMITLLMNFLGNIFDESRDQIIGENEINQTTGKSKDKTENIFFMKQFIPGWKIFESLDWFGEEEK